MEDEAKTPSVFGGNVNVVNPQNLVAALDESAARDPRGGLADGSDYASFTGKRGVYELGQEKKDADPEELWVVDISRFQDGWICWRGGQAMATRMFPLGTPVATPDMNEHGPFTKDGDGWYQAKAMVLKSVDTGQQIYFKNNSVSGVSEMAKLQKAVVTNLRSGLPSWPVVMLKKESFTAQGHKNFKPVFEIDGWLSNEAMQDLASALEGDSEINMDDLYDKSIKSPVGEIPDNVQEAAADMDMDTGAAPDRTEPAPQQTQATKPVARRKRI